MSIEKHETGDFTESFFPFSKIKEWDSTFNANEWVWYGIRVGDARYGMFSPCNMVHKKFFGLMGQN